MNTFYLIRHGQKIANLGDMPLTPVGIKQAETTGDFLKDKAIAKIYSSPTKRTKQTAEIIGKKFGLKAKIDKRLLERMNWDDEKRETWEEFIQEWYKTDDDRDYISSRGISARQNGQRFEELLIEIDKKYENKNIIVVTHGGTINDILKNKFSDKDLPLVEHSKVPIKHINILECSITLIKLGNGKFRLLEVGNINHLPTPIN